MKNDKIIEIIKNITSKFLLFTSDLIHLSFDPKTINIKNGIKKGTISL